MDGFAGGGCILCSNKGIHAANCFNYYGLGTSNYVKARALLDGLVLCLKMGVPRVFIQAVSTLQNPLATKESVSKDM